MPSLIAYVETNWLIALASPWDERFPAARALLAKARAGEIEARLPVVAVLEAKTAWANAAQTFLKSVETVQAGVTRLARREGEGADDKLLDLARGLREASVTLIDRTAMDRVLDDEVVKRAQFADPEREFQRIVELGAATRLEKPDLFDLYILSAMLADRDKRGMADPAAVLSTNRRDFTPGKKVAASFYTARHLVYLDRFEADEALGKWKARDKEGWVDPA